MKLKSEFTPKDAVLVENDYNQHPFRLRSVTPIALLTALFLCSVFSCILTNVIADSDAVDTADGGSSILVFFNDKSDNISSAYVGRIWKVSKYNNVPVFSVYI